MAQTDEEIKKDVVDQLYWDSRVDASKIHVKVNDGKVILDGEVPSYSAKGSASSDAWTISGVNIVENELDVEYPETLTLPTDEEIKNNVETSLSLNINIDTSDIDISVTAGIVTLEGSVDAYWKKTRAESIASGVNGVLDVINKLTIVPTKNFIDKDISEDIVKSISRNYRVSIDDVDVKVENGVVTLTGTVPDWDAYRAVIDSAEFTAGIIDIEDHLIIENL
ncbi:MAG: BON domain-containing protein [Promethearchaeota archaeon]|nr:MAG: BON domain-containing protein [Candidatus Lokiarchaeota archaeon]